MVLFSCLARQTSATRQATGTTGGVWAAHGDGPLGPFDLANAYELTDDTLYSGRLVRRRDEPGWLLFAFHNGGSDGTFVGSISDPMPVTRRSDGTLAVLREPVGREPRVG